MPDNPGCVFTCHGQDILATYTCIHIGFTQDLVNRLLDELRLAFFYDENGVFVSREVHEFIRNQWIRYIKHIDRHIGFTEVVSIPKCGKRSTGRIKQSALYHNPNICMFARQKFVELMLGDVTNRCRPSFLNLFLLLFIGRRRQHDFTRITCWMTECILSRKPGGNVVSGRIFAMHMTRTYTHHEHHRCRTGLGELKAMMHHIHDMCLLRTRVEQPDLRFHGKRMCALLHDTCTFAIVLAQDDERTTHDTSRRKVGKRIRGDVCADSRLPRYSPTHWIVNRSSKHRRRGRLTCRRFKTNRQFFKKGGSIRKHIHQM